jgi:uncharacterized membrane protein YeaQ/YmgE (transglycosylase-associated protein family)
MSILAWIVVGIIAGWLAEKIMGRDHSLLTNLIVGVVGAFVGGFLMSTIFGFRYTEGFNFASILVATLGAVVFLFIWGMISGRRHA